MRDGATHTLEADTLVRAGGRDTAIIVEPGDRIVAERTPEAPVVLGCSTPVGQREPGCRGAYGFSGGPSDAPGGRGTERAAAGLAGLRGPDAEENWLEGWTVFGPESAYDLRGRAGEDD